MGKTLAQFKRQAAERRRCWRQGLGIRHGRHESAGSTITARFRTQATRSSRFYLSLQDDLLRIFGSDRIAGLMNKLGMEEDVPIEHRMVSRAIENAQKKVEDHNFDMRKHILEYDDVMNQQRKVIYEQRRQILAGTDSRRGAQSRRRLFDGVIGFTALRTPMPRPGTSPGSGMRWRQSSPIA
jgi:preprotein translocase subunit SecA